MATTFTDWDDSKSRTFLSDPRDVLSPREPRDVAGEEVIIFHRCESADLLAQVVTKFRVYGATEVRLHDLR